MDLSRRGSSAVVAAAAAATAGTAGTATATAAGATLVVDGVLVVEKSVMASATLSLPSSYVSSPSKQNMRHKPHSPSSLLGNAHQQWLDRLRRWVQQPNEQNDGDDEQKRLDDDGSNAMARILRQVLVPVLPYGIIGIVCGVVAFVYYVCLESLLHVVWKTLPMLLLPFDESNGNNESDDNTINLIWTIPVGVFGGTIVMVAAIWYFGESMDLAATLTSIHERGLVPASIVPGMAACSLASIVSGASLGPEAPLVSMCAAVAGAVSRHVLVPIFGMSPSSSHDGHTSATSTNNIDMIRHHSVLGMSCATAAFFGCPLGGSLFALEVLSARFSHNHGRPITSTSTSHSSMASASATRTIEYVQHYGLSAIATGTVALAVFRYLANLPIEPIWNVTQATRSFHPTHVPSATVDQLLAATPQHMLAGAVLGALGAALACAYAVLRNHVKQSIQRVAECVVSLIVVVDTTGNGTRHYWMGLVATRALLGAVCIATLGVWFPHSLFWGEFEVQAVAALAPVRALPHLLGAYMTSPVNGLVDLESDNLWHLALTAVCIGSAKFLAIACSIAGGYRGGFIFPLFCAAAAFGRALHLLLMLFPISSDEGQDAGTVAATSITTIIPLQLCVLGLAAAVNVAVTRTAMATTLILTYLSGEPNALPALLVASLVSLYLTSFTPWVFPVPVQPVQAPVFVPASKTTMQTTAARVEQESKGADPLLVGIGVDTQDDDADDELMKLLSDENFA